MKHLAFFVLFLGLNTDSSFDYKNLIGSWGQKSIANTKNMGVFIFRADSTASFEMRKDNTDQLIGGMTGPYSISKSKRILKVSMLGREKVFKLIKLTKDSMIINNLAENKEPQTFVRLK